MDCNKNKYCLLRRLECFFQVIIIVINFLLYKGIFEKFHYRFFPRSTPNHLKNVEKCHIESYIERSSLFIHQQNRYISHSSRFTTKPYQSASMLI